MSIVLKVIAGALGASFSSPLVSTGCSSRINST
jgi:hypothetical protein